MKLITQDTILQHKDFKKSVQFADLGSHPHIHLLYVLRDLLGKKKVNYLEIGVYLGGSIKVVGSHKYPTKIIGIDDFSARRSQIQTARDNVKPFEAHLIERDSHAPETVEEVKTLLNGETVDLLYIDGDHAEPSVAKDFELYSPLLSPNSFLVFDDAFMPHIFNIAENAVKTHDDYHKVGRLPNALELRDPPSPTLPDYYSYIIQKYDHNTRLHRTESDSVSDAKHDARNPSKGRNRRRTDKSKRTPKR